MNDKTKIRPNAAYLLADALTRWEVPPGEMPQHRRGFGGEPNDVEPWRVFTQEAELVRIVDDTLLGMDAAGGYVEMFLDALPRWYAGVYMAATPWNLRADNRTLPACDQTDINLLRALGALIDNNGPVQLNEVDQRSLTGVLAEARVLLEEDADHIPKDVRHYLWGLISRAQMVLEGIDRYGPEAVRQVALELGGACVTQAQRAEAQGDGDKGKSWRATAYMFVAGFMGGAATGVGTAIGEAGMKAIGS